MTELVKFDEARRAIMEARSIDEVKEIRDKAEALRLYVKQQGDSLEMQNACAEIKLRAERRAGELLAEMAKNPGVELNGRDSFGGNIVLPPKNNTPTLKDIGLSKIQSHRWQSIASLPEQTFEQHISETKAKGELTTAGVLKLAKKIRRQKPKPKPAPLPAQKQPILIVARAEDTGLPDESIDLIITSPPYNLGSNQWPMGGDGRIPRENGIGYQDEIPENDYRQWQLDTLNEMYRIARPGVSLFYNHKVRTKNGAIIHPIQWLDDQANPWLIRQEIIWDRKSTHNHAPTLFWPEDERIYWLTKGKPALPESPIGMSTIWRFFGPKNDTWHPAPFPEELPERCIKAIGRKGITVLDPFAGSCTTVKVALSYGYEAIGIDTNREYLETAKEENGWTAKIQLPEMATSTIF